MVVRRGRRKNLDVSWLPAASFKNFLVSVLLPTDTPLKLSRFLKLRHEIALQPKLSENASSQIGCGSQKLLEIWP